MTGPIEATSGWGAGISPSRSHRFVTVDDEVGLYLTHVQVRVFHIDFTHGVKEWIGFGVPLG